jgi:hypothetical protein
MARFLEEDDDHEPGHNGSTKRLWLRLDSKGKQKTGLLERVFGICSADSKEGREASNVIHPQSPFATGAQERTVRDGDPGRARPGLQLICLIDC